MTDLLDKLRALAGVLPPSHIAGPAELPGMVSALVHFIEHGDEIVRYALSGAINPTKGVSELEVLLSPNSEPRAISTVQPVSGGLASPASADDVAALSRQIMEMQRLLATQQTVGMMAQPATPLPPFVLSPAATVPASGVSPGASSDLPPDDAPAPATFTPFDQALSEAEAEVAMLKAQVGALLAERDRLPAIVGNIETSQGPATPMLPSDAPAPVLDPTPIAPLDSTPKE